MRSYATFVVACVLTGVLAGGVLGAGPAERPDADRRAGMQIKGLFPRFTPGQREYVLRCERPISGFTDARAKVNGRRVSGAFRVRAPRPGKNFVVRAYGRRYGVRCLPRQFPRWRFDAFRSSAKDMFIVNAKTTRSGPHWAIVFDEKGMPRWWMRTPPNINAVIRPDRHVAWSRAFGDNYGRNPEMAHEVHSLRGGRVRVVRAHDAVIDGHEHLKVGDSLYVVSYKPRCGIDLSRWGGGADACAVLAEVQELDRHGNLRWKWNSHSRIGLGETGRWWNHVLRRGKRDAQNRQIYDPVHINSVDVLPVRNQVMISTRHTDAVFGIDKSSGRIVWKLGGTKRPESLRVVGGPRRRSPFAGQHDARMRGNVLSVYDNGTRRRHRPPRLVLYRLDLERGTATFLRAYRDPKIMFSHCCGSARPFAQGWLVNWGGRKTITSFSTSGAIRSRLRLSTAVYRAAPVPATVTRGYLRRAMEMKERR